MHFLADVNINKREKSPHHTPQTRHSISSWSICCDTVRFLQLTEESEIVFSEEVKHSLFVSIMFISMSMHWREKRYFYLAKSLRLSGFFQS